MKKHSYLEIMTEEMKTERKEERYGVGHRHRDRKIGCQRGGRERERERDLYIITAASHSLKS